MEFLDTLETLQKNIEKLNQTDYVSRVNNIITQTDPKESLAYQHMAIMKEISDNTRSLEVQAQELKRLADSAEQKAMLAEKESKLAADSAKSSAKDSLFSKAISIISCLVSIGSLAVSILALLG